MKNRKTVIFIAAAVLAIGGSGLLLTMGGKLIGQRNLTGELTGPVSAGEVLDDLQVSAPAMDFSVSPLGESGLSDFNLGQGVSGDLFGSISLNTDIGYGGKVTLTVPKTEISAPNSYNIQVPSSQQPPSQPPSGNGQPASPSVSASDCAQFSSVPSCGYIPDPNGQALCEQCRAAGY
ncbi:hypothetical protein JW899_02450 [Candidatus Uhrbacteria bacterium]|nr:hypothetical protein [Candidatus Uhrbacteria bacterium]